MTRSFDPDPLNPRRTRRETLRALGAGAVVLGMDFAPGSALGQGSEETVLTEALVLRDPDIPAAGNVDGDITIVEYFDYQCPYCRKIEPELRQVVQDDYRRRSPQSRPRHQCQGDRRDPCAQRRSSQGIRFQGDAVLHRRQISRGRRIDDGAVRSGHCRCAESGGEQIADNRQRNALIDGRGRFDICARMV